MRSAAYGHTLGASVCLCHVRAWEPITPAFVSSATFELDLAGQKPPSKAYLRAPYDPSSEIPKTDA